MERTEINNDGNRSLGSDSLDGRSKMTDAELAILKTELDTDPYTLGYSGMDDPTAAAKLNELGASSETIDREAIDGQLLQYEVVISEYIALSGVAREAWTALISAGSGIVAIADSRVIVQIAAIWVSGTTTRSNLQTLQTRDASRAEKLFSIGVSVSHIDVGRARGPI